MRNEDEFNARWAEFLKDNLGIDVYKKFLARQRKTDLQFTNSAVAELEQRVKMIKEEFQEENAKLKKWKTEQTQKIQKFKTDFADVLDENGNIIDL